MTYITSYYLYPDGQLYDYEPSLSVNDGSVGYSLHIRLKIDFYDDITILYRGSYYPAIRTYFILQFMGDTGMERQLYNYHRVSLQHDYEQIPSMPAGGMVISPTCSFDDSEGEGIYGCYSNTPDYIYGGGGRRPPVYGAPGVWTDWVNSETYWSQASDPLRYIDTPFEDIPPGPQDSVIFKGGGFWIRGWKWGNYHFNTSNYSFYITDVYIPLPKIDKIYIYNGTEWVKTTPYIYNGTEWVRTTPYIWNGTEWK